MLSGSSSGATRHFVSLGRLVVVAAAVAAALVVSLMTRPYDDQRLRGLVCWLPLDEEAMK